MTPEQLIEAIENQDASVIDQEIEQHQLALDLLHRAKRIIERNTPPVKTRKPYKRRAKYRQVAPSGPIGETKVGNPDGTPAERVEAFLRKNGPTGFRDILKGVGLHPRQLVNALDELGIEKVGGVYEALR